jgi:hypothetical protein
MQEDFLLDPRDPSLVKVMSRLIQFGTYQRHVATPAMNASIKYGPDSVVDGRIKEFMHGYLQSLKGPTGDPTAEFVDKFMGQLGRILFPFSQKTGKEMADTVIGQTYAGLMGYRPSTIMRNATQTLQTGVPVYGPRSWAAGVSKFMTAEGREIVERSGSSRGQRSTRHPNAAWYGPHGTESLAESQGPKDWALGIPESREFQPRG